MGFLADPEMAATDTSTYGGPEVGWSANQWEKSGGGLRVIALADPDAYILIPGLTPGAKYICAYNIEGLALNAIQVESGATYLGNEEQCQVGARSFQFTAQGTQQLIELYAYPEAQNPGFEEGITVIDYFRVSEMHARQIIREAAAGIVTGLATTGARVFQSRAYNVQESELPCLLIYTTSEEIEKDTLTDPATLFRTLTLVVEGKGQAAADLDDILDNIGEEVEIVVATDTTLGVGAYDIMLEDVNIDFSADGDQPIGSIVMRYAVQYRSAENAPGVII